MNIFLSHRERIAALFLLLSGLVVIGFFVGAAIQNRWFEDRVSFHTYIERGEGLRTGSPILLAGIEVGEVGEIGILKDDRIDVEILILERYAPRVRLGSLAVVRRLLGIGEKRIQIESRGSHRNAEPLAPGSVMAAEEPVDVIDAVAQLDLGRYFSAMDRAVTAMDLLLKKLEENNRLERMIIAFDQMGPTMERMNSLFTDIEQPLSEMLKDPNLRGTFKGANRVFNHPATTTAMDNLSSSMSPAKLGGILARGESVLSQLDKTLAAGHLDNTLAGADRLINDGRLDRTLTSLEKLSDGERLDRLVTNMAIIADQLAAIGPEIPTITKEMIVTLREAVIVLKAAQKTWLLETEADEVRQEQKKKSPAAP